MKKSKNKAGGNKENSNLLNFSFAGIMLLIAFFGYSGGKLENKIVISEENKISKNYPKETSHPSLYPSFSSPSILASAKSVLENELSSRLKDLNQNSLSNISEEEIKKREKEKELKNLLLGVLSTDKVLALNLSTGKTIFASNEEILWPTASLAKIMTAVIAVEKMGFEKEVKITPDAVAIENEAGDFKVGEVFTVKDLLSSIFLVSSNDAAYAIGNEYGLEDFISAMNAKAQELKMTSTNFIDPAGLSENNITTLSDLSKLAAYIFRERPELLFFSRQKEAEIKDLRFGNVKIYTSINKFSERDDFIGGKTGYTDIAKENLLSLFSFKNEAILIVILGSEDRFSDSEKIFNFITGQNI